MSLIQETKEKKISSEQTTIAEVYTEKNEWIENYPFEKMETTQGSIILWKFAGVVLLCFLGVTFGPPAVLAVGEKIPKGWVRLTPELKEKILQESKEKLAGTGFQVKDYRRLGSLVRQPDFPKPKKTSYPPLVEIIQLAYLGIRVILDGISIFKQPPPTTDSLLLSRIERIENRLQELPKVTRNEQILAMIGTSLVFNLGVSMSNFMFKQVATFLQEEWKKKNFRKRNHSD